MAYSFLHRCSAVQSEPQAEPAEHIAQPVVITHRRHSQMEAQNSVVGRAQNREDFGSTHGENFLPDKTREMMKLRAMLSIPLSIGNENEITLISAESIIYQF